MNDRLKLIPLLLLIAQFGFSQELPEVKSANHIQINGTNIFMIPPTSYESSTNFKGFQDPNDQTAMIMTIEIPGPYSEVTMGFNAETLKTQGMELKNKTAIKVAEFDGWLIELDQEANGLTFSKHIIIYGNEESTMLINGAYLKDSISTGQKIKESVLTTIVDSKLKSDPREALNYSLDETIGALKFHSVIGNGMLFNRDLKTPTESVDQATLWSDMSFAKVEVENKKVFCVSRLEQYPENYSVISSKGINEIELDSIKGFELYAQSGENENEEMYQVVLFNNDGGYYLLVGTYLKTNEKALSDLKSIIKTFKRKE